MKTLIIFKDKLMSNHTTGDGKIPERQKNSVKKNNECFCSYGLRNYTVKDLQNLKGKKIS